jgi:DNA-binding CsgD family transcriptional regulator/PAS domain-containing protein
MANKDEKDSPAFLKRQHAILTAVLDGTSDIILILDKRLRIRGASGRALAVFGIPPIIGEYPSLVEILAGGSRLSLTEAIERDDGCKGVLLVEASFLQADGRSFHASVTMRHLPDEGSARGWTFLIVTRRDSSEEALGSSGFSHLVARVLRGYTDPVLVLDAASRTIRDCNEYAIAALGFERGEIVGRSFDRFAEGGSIPDEADRTARFAYATAGVFQSKICLRRKDGILRTFALTNVAVLDVHGIIESILCIMHDKSDEESRKAELARLSGDIASFSRQLESLASLFSGAKPAPRLSDQGLSAKQIDVIRLVSEGLTTKAIAHELGVAEATVKSHLARVYRRLDVKSRTDLLRFMHEGGYLFE